MQSFSNFRRRATGKRPHDILKRFETPYSNLIAFRRRRTVTDATWLGRSSVDALAGERHAAIRVDTH
jgi:hypothetical protein